MKKKIQIIKTERRQNYKKKIVKFSKKKKEKEIPVNMSETDPTSSLMTIIQIQHHFNCDNDNKIYLKRIIKE